MRIYGSNGLKKLLGHASFLVSYWTLAPGLPDWLMRSQRGQKCEEIENGELTVPRRRIDRRKTIREVEKSYQNTSIVTLIFSTIGVTGARLTRRV